MSDWWEVGYPGGPMVAVPGFPRPLYFPGNPGGYPASVDGPDVLAYKRTVSRAGRWPWTNFNDTYTEEFAVGRPGGNVPETGVAGVQRQLGISPDSGYIGEKTFNGLRSIRIPEPLPHAGEPAMDVTAQNLIGEAWQMFAGKPSKPVREQALDGAREWLGYVEQANNNTPFGSWYGANHQPWCAMFVTYCFEIEAPGSPSFIRGSRYAYCPYIVSDARAQRYGLSVTSSPAAGDLVVYDWQGDGTFDHVGIFESGSASSWQAVEGNTSPADYSNGGQVMRCSRTSSQASVVFVRVAEP
jgi:hypothetical protein